MSERYPLKIWVDEWTLRRLHALAAIGPFGDTEVGVSAEAAVRLDEALTHLTEPDEMEAIIGALAPPEGVEVN